MASDETRETPKVPMSPHLGSVATEESCKSASLNFEVRAYAFDPKMGSATTVRREASRDLSDFPVCLHTEAPQSLWADVPLQRALYGPRSDQLQSIAERSSHIQADRAQRSHLSIHTLR